MKGDWALAEWYPNQRFKSGKDEEDEKESPAKPISSTAKAEENAAAYVGPKGSIP